MAKAMLETLASERSLGKPRPTLPKLPKVKAQRIARNRMPQRKSQPYNSKRQGCPSTHPAALMVLCQEPHPTVATTHATTASA
jgi:hypothetical protein